MDRTRELQLRTSSNCNSTVVNSNKLYWRVHKWRIRLPGNHALISVLPPLIPPTIFQLRFSLDSYGPVTCAQVLHRRTSFRHCSPLSFIVYACNNLYRWEKGGLFFYDRLFYFVGVFLCFVFFIGQPLPINNWLLARPPIGSNQHYWGSGRIKCAWLHVITITTDDLPPRLETIPSKQQILEWRIEASESPDCHSLKWKIEERGKANSSVDN